MKTNLMNACKKAYTVFKEELHTPDVHANYCLVKETTDGNETFFFMTVAEMAEAAFVIPDKQQFYVYKLKDCYKEFSQAIDKFFSENVLEEKLSKSDIVKQVSKYQDITSVDFSSDVRGIPNIKGP